jgi:hypothetical protein
MPAMKSFGKGLLKFLKDPTGATRDMFVKATIAAKDFVDETSKEVDALIEVTNMRQKAHHIDRELKVERAEANRKINDIRLQAEDREKNSATERIELLRKAQKIEEDITKKEIKSKQLLIDAQILHMEQGHNNIEQNDKLAQLQADAINLDTKRLRSQRLLQTQITTALNEEMAARKAGEKSAEEFWSKVLSAPKVKRILEKRGFSPDAFRKDYESDTSRGPRSPKKPSRSEWDAVELFQETGDFDALRSSLGTKSAAVANNALRRVLQFKAKGGVKTIRRRAAPAPIGA